ncbi:helix-turn-helix domain-containing protein [Streptomyces fradiae]|uniref:helix-turn-helix domain-containing protein n=1 Tax=Streptomyces fradiae TaxID=1906 RepID=UPI002942254D|nr:helix-turn-helix transcriptional regulator [Streptomyces fradiae]WOI59334.1 helix-turn-helix transcriptional regulator [Streptomyces fradiae]
MALDGNEEGNATAAETELPEGLKIFGSVLQSLRRAAGLTQEELAARVRYSPGYIAKIEQGRRFPPVDLPARSQPALGEVAANVLSAVVKDLRRRTGLATWFRQWAEIEEEALTLYAYECRVVPGLLQPEPYMREVLGSHLPPLTDAQVESQAAARLARQELLTKRANTTFGFIVEQHVIERGLGGTEVTRHLIDHLLTCARLRNVELLIMPRSRIAHAGLSGPLYLAETPGHEWVGYVESHEASLLYTDPKQVGTLLQRYGRMQGQALDSETSASLLEQLRGAP